MVFEAIKVVIAVLAFFTVGITLNVAIIAVLGALVAQCIVLLLMLPRELYTQRFDKGVVKRWLKIGWLPSFVTVSGYIGTVDSLIVTLITGSTLALANYRPHMLLQFNFSCWGLHICIVSKADRRRRSR